MLLQRAHCDAFETSTTREQLWLSARLIGLAANSSACLYTAADEEALYRILTLKYLGLSLADIREQQHQIGDAMALRRLLVKAMEEVESSFQSLVKRLLTLHALFSESGRGRNAW